MTKAYVNAVLLGHNPPTRAILFPLGLRRVICFALDKAKSMARKKVSQRGGQPSWRRSMKSLGKAVHRQARLYTGPLSSATPKSSHGRSHRFAMTPRRCRSRLRGWRAWIVQTRARGVICCRVSLRSGLGSMRLTWGSCSPVIPHAFLKLSASGGKGGLPWGQPQPS